MRRVVASLVVCSLALGAAFVVTWFNDSTVPETIEEQFKVKVIDASMRFYKALMSTMVDFGLTYPFSPWDRYLADKFLLTQITGLPWWSYSGPGLHITDRQMAGVQVRVYEPTATLGHQALRPVVVYIHGGAWTMLSVDSYEPFTSRLALDANVVVVSVNYRRSPQFPFPVPRQDSMAVVEYVLQHSRELRIDVNRIALAGDSCGGNLVASLTLELAKAVSLQMLLVPALQPINTLTPSAVENGVYMSSSINDRRMYSSYLLYGGIRLEAYPFLINNSHIPIDVQRKFASSHLNIGRLVPPEVIRNSELRPQKNPDLADEKPATFNKERQPWAENMSKVFMNPLFAPLLADDDVLRHLPRSYVMTAGYDVIRDDGVMYHHRLNRLGVPGIWKNYPEAFHHACLFHSGPLKLKVGELIFKDVVDYIRKYL